MPWPYLPGRQRLTRIERLAMRMQRVRCWWRYYHRKTAEIGRFRYDQPGICCDCGRVGTGIGKDGE